MKRLRRPRMGLPWMIAEANTLAHGAGSAGELERTGLAIAKASIRRREATVKRDRLASSVRTGVAQRLPGSIRRFER